MDDLPALLWPERGRYGLKHLRKGLLRGSGGRHPWQARHRPGAGLLLVCPKQSVAQVLPLKVRAALSDCDAGVMRAV